MPKPKNLIEVICAACGAVFKRHSYLVSGAAKQGSKLAYCNRKCFQHKGEARARDLDIWSFVDVKGPNECWLWKGSNKDDNYQRIRLNGKAPYVHRVAYKVFHKMEREPDLLMHSCDVRPCCNPYHLSEGNYDLNNADAAKKNRTAFGIKNFNTKLNDEKVIQIIQAWQNGSKRNSLAKEFGVTFATINLIITKQTWRRVWERLEKSA